MSEALLHAAVAIASIAVILAVTRAKAPNAVRWDYAAGALLLFLGAYFFPLGALEAYDFTRLRWHLSESMNAILWYVISTGLFVAGILVLKRRRA